MLLNFDFSFEAFTEMLKARQKLKNWVVSLKKKVWSVTNLQKLGFMSEEITILSRFNSKQATGETIIRKWYKSLIQIIKVL